MSGTDDEGVLKEARRHLGLDSRRLNDNDAGEILASVIGDIYRDMFYRLLLKQHTQLADEEERESVRSRFVGNLTFSPVRLLLDRYLDGWNSPSQFSQACGLRLEETKKLLSSLTKDPGELELSIDRLTQVFERLGVCAAKCRSALFLVSTLVSVTAVELRVPPVQHRWSAPCMRQRFLQSRCSS